MIVLPIAVLGVFFLILNSRENASQIGEEDWRAAFFSAATIWAVLLVVILETLSMVDAINQLSLSVAWLLALIVGITIGNRTSTLGVGWNNFTRSWRSFSRGEALLLAGILSIIIVLFIVAVVAPPNNVDSLIYHLPRIGQWAQNQSLRHFATAENGQLVKPIFTEMSILNLRVLVGDDTPVNLVQWFSMVGCLIGVSAIASLLKANRLQQILTVAFAVSIPIGVLHATNTKNDYVVAFWMVCLVYLVVLSRRRTLSGLELGSVGLVLGLGLLTKGTFYPYAFPVMVWFFLPRFKKNGIGRTLLQGAAIAGLAILLNLGYWARNINTYGGLYGPAASLRSPLQIDEVFSATGQILDLSDSAEQEGKTPSPNMGINAEEPDTGEGFIATVITSLRSMGEFIWGRLQWLRVRVARNLAQNIVYPELAEPLRNTLYKLPGIFDDEYIGSLKLGLWNHEDTAGSLFHLVLILISMMLVTIRSIRSSGFLSIEYILAILLGFMFLSFISYSVKLFGVRYQLAFFVLGAPLVGVAASIINRRWPTFLLASTLILSAVPYVLLNNTRPIVGWKPRTRTESIFKATGEDLMFPIVPEFQDAYVQIAEIIQSTECKDVGLLISGGELEYLFWWMLDAPQSGIRVASMSPVPPSDQYVDPEFDACAVICKTCSSTSQFEGLVLLVDYGHTQLFVDPTLIIEFDE